MVAILASFQGRDDEKFEAINAQYHGSRIDSVGVSFQGIDDEKLKVINDQ